MPTEWEALVLAIGFEVVRFVVGMCEIQVEYGESYSCLSDGVFIIYIALQGVVILFFHVIRNEKVWSKIGPRLTTIRQKTLSSNFWTQKHEVVSFFYWHKYTHACTDDWEAQGCDNNINIYYMLSHFWG